MITQKQINNAPRPMAMLSPEETVRRLDSLLVELDGRYRELDRAVAAHEEAIRRADIDAMAASVAQENEAIQAIAQLDAKRAEVVALYHRSLGSVPEDDSPGTVTAIARRIGGESGGRLAERAGALRELISSVRNRADALREAADMLSAHTAGIMRQVVQMLNHAQVYSRGGSVGAGPTVTSALDITS